jgi:uncharacterized protein
VSPDEIQQRPREALRAAMKAKDTVAVSALRSVLAAIANAEAIPVAAPASNAGPAGNTVPPGNPAPASQAVTGGDQRVAGSHVAGSHVAGSAAGLGAAEARRRELTGTDIAAIIGAEVTERRSAARQYDSTGNAERAGRLRREAEIIESAGRAPVL